MALFEVMHFWKRAHEIKTNERRRGHSAGARASVHSRPRGVSAILGCMDDLDDSMMDREPLQALRRARLPCASSSRPTAPRTKTRARVRASARMQRPTGLPCGRAPTLCPLWASIVVRRQVCSRTHAVGHSSVPSVFIAASPRAPLRPAARHLSSFEAPP
jgi:hypothetical protein